MFFCIRPSPPLTETDKRQFHCCFTGHRPEKLKTSKDAILVSLQEEITAAIKGGITTFLSGMTRGVDLWAAGIVTEIKKENPRIKLICAIPYADFEKSWSSEWQLQYQNILSFSDYTKIFYPSFRYNAFAHRNHWMVDHSCQIIAVYQGVPGGTCQTLEYAKQQNLKISLIF